MTPEEKRERQREASRRWRERNPEKVQAANSKPRNRPYDPEYRRDWYARTKEQRRPVSRVQERERATTLRAWLSDYKAAAGCVDCGYRDPRALDFDHVDGTKDLNVSFAKSRAQAEREIAKCQVRCANCHRIRSWERLQARKSA